MTGIGLWVSFSSATLALAIGTAAFAQSPVSTTAPPSTSSTGTATATAADDAAARFGALETIVSISLSPDGNAIAYISPEEGRARALYVVGTDEGAVPRQILRSSGDPEHLSSCHWATAQRLVCTIFLRDRVSGRVMGASRVVAVDAEGGNLLLLSNIANSNSLYSDLRGGGVIDWLPGQTGSILMMRAYVPENSTGTHIVSNAEGMGVDRVDVRTGSSRRVESPRNDASDYISDGQGNVRLLTTYTVNDGTGYINPTINFLYRRAASRQWEPLGTYDLAAETGFYPVAVDPASDAAIGYSKVDGRTVVSSVALDGTMASRVLFSHPQVDVDTILFAGRGRRVVGASFVTEKREAIVTDGRLRAMTDALGRALGGVSVHIADSNDDESRYLVFASSDTDAGQYYLYTPATRQLRPLLEERPQLATLTLSTVQPITYPAADGTMIPGYLTLPPGRSDARGLPAIVMPHGGPSARDEWGFDWMAQYFAQQGFAVLQPNFRGSSGYGDAWYQRNGFQSWRTAIGDVTDGGRWLVAQGADPAKLSIVGWSYGGYAALQSGVLAPDLFRAIVAIAPVTDLERLRRDAAGFSSGRIERAFIGTGPHIREGSPALNAEFIAAPVLMFHGGQDQNVEIEQSRIMQRALQQAGKRVELIEYEGLAHSLTTSEARTDMLRRIAAFLPS